LLAIAEAYFVIAPHLPSTTGDGAFFLSTIPALLLAIGLVIAALPFRDSLRALAVLALVGALAGALLSSPLPEAAAPPKALFAAAVGFALARFIPVGSIVYLLAIAIAVADAISVSVGPTHYLVTEQPRVVDYLALTIPAWGGAFSQLGISDLIFLAVYLAAAWRFGLRRRVTAAALSLSLVGSLGIAVWTEWTVPALPLLSLALLLPNADRVWDALRRDWREYR